MQHVGHLIPRDEQAAEDDLREHQHRQELHRLELGAREGARQQSQRGAEHGIHHGDQTELPQRPVHVEPADSDRERHRDDGLQGRHHPERQGVADDEVRLAERRRHQSLEGARATLPQGRDRGDQEHHDEREQRQDGAAEPVEDTILIAEQPGEQPDEKARRNEHQRDRSRVVTELAQHARGGGEHPHDTGSSRCSRRRCGCVRSSFSISRRNAVSGSDAPVSASRRSAVV